VGQANHQSPEVLAVALVSPLPSLFAMHPLDAFLIVCLPPPDQEQALFTCGETANSPHQISILAVATVTFSSRPTFTGSFNLQITKYILLGYFYI
jgi:hypothetical protein